MRRRCRCDRDVVTGPAQMFMPLFITDSSAHRNDWLRASPEGQGLWGVSGMHSSAHTKSGPKKDPMTWRQGHEHSRLFNACEE